MQRNPPSSYSNDILTSLLNRQRQDTISVEIDFFALLNQTMPINRNEKKESLFCYPSIAAPAMFQLMHELFFFIDKIPPSNLKDTQVYESTKKLIRNMIERKEDKKIALTIHGMQSFLLAKAYLYYLEILKNTESISKKEKKEAFKHHKNLKKIVSRCYYNNEISTTVDDMFDMIECQKRRKLESADGRFSDEINNLNHLLSSHDEEKKALNIQYALEKLTVASVAFLTKIVEQPEKYFYTANNKAKNEILKDLLFMHHPAEYMLLKRLNHLHHLFESNAFVDEEISFHFSSPLLFKSQTQRKQLISIIHQNEIEEKYLTKNLVVNSADDLSDISENELSTELKKGKSRLKNTQELLRKITSISTHGIKSLYDHFKRNKPSKILPENNFQLPQNEEATVPTSIQK